MTTRARFMAAIVFATMMALFEAAVVVYLRRLWSIGEIDIAAALLSNRLIRAEICREIASLLMIAAVAVLAGRRNLERLAYGAVIFGVWDLLYYVDLRLLMGFPKSLLDWDVLFLIPRPWIGPVLAPVLVSIALILSGCYAILREEAGRPLRVAAYAWAGAIAGGGMVTASFLLPDVPSSATAIPSGFSWTLFTAGLLVAVGACLLAITDRRSPRSHLSRRLKLADDVERSSSAPRSGIGRAG